jgi:hypothetical protein
VLVSVSCRALASASRDSPELIVSPMSARSASLPVVVVAFVARAGVQYEGGDQQGGGRAHRRLTARQGWCCNFPIVRRGSRDLVPVGYEGRLAALARHD